MTPASGGATTRSWGLSRLELVTTAVAVVVSVTGYLALGFPYLARGVVGDLVGLSLLSAVALARRERLRHEALLCLALIGVVLLLDPQWPLAVRESVWWAAVAVALAAYLALRRTRATDG